MSTFFTTKEQYLEFKASWSKAVNSEDAKSKLQPCDEYKYDIPKGTILEGWKQVREGGSMWISKGTGRYKESGWMEGEHHMMYNILRDKPLHTGFSPLVSKRKLNVCESPWHNFYDTVRVLRNRVRTAKMLVKDDETNTFYDKANGFMDKLKTITGSKKKKEGALERWKRENYAEKMHNFLLPFEGAITYKMLAKIDDDSLTLILGFDKQDKPNYLF